MSKQRERFERWAFKEGFNIARFDQYRYADNETMSAWMGWQAACPDGWKCVPKEPTQYQQNAGSVERYYYENDCRGIYGAMLSAAPKPDDD